MVKSRDQNLLSLGQIEALRKKRLAPVKAALRRMPRRKHGGGDAAILALLLLQAAAVATAAAPPPGGRNETRLDPAELARAQEEAQRAAAEELPARWRDSSAFARAIPELQAQKDAALLVAGLSFHLAQADMVAAALEALGALVEVPASEVARAFRAGAVPATLAAMDTHGSEHAVVLQACTLLWGITAPSPEQEDIRRDFGERGGIAALNAALDAFGDDPAIVAAMFGALENVMADNPANTAAVIAASGIDRVAELLPRFPDNAWLQERAIVTLHSLANSDSAAQERLNALGVDTPVRAAMERPDATASTKEWGQKLLNKLPSVSREQECGTTQCAALLELCHACKITNTHGHALRVVQNATQATRRIQSESQCAAQCKRNEDCYGVIWNSATGYCARYWKVTYDVSKDPADRETKLLHCLSCAAHEVAPDQWMLRWIPEHFTSKDNLLEIATIHRGMVPNKEPFFAASNAGAIIARGMLVVPNNGSFLWNHSQHVGLSAEGWFSFRSLPFPWHDCRVDGEGGLQKGHVRLQARQCSTISTEDRVDCGYSGINSQECVARGCCYDVARPDAANCFTSFPKHHRLAYFSWLVRKHLGTAAAWAGSCLKACLDGVATIAVSIYETLIVAFLLHPATLCSLILTGALMYSQNRQELQRARLELAGRLLNLKLFDRFRAARRKILNAEAHGHLVLRKGDAQEDGQGRNGQCCCVCCYTSAPNVVLLPCGHLSCCHLCVSSLWERRLFDNLEFLCPNCQTTVDSLTFPIPQGV